MSDAGSPELAALRELGEEWGTLAGRDEQLRALPVDPDRRPRSARRQPPKGSLRRPGGLRPRRPSGRGHGDPRGRGRADARRLGPAQGQASRAGPAAGADRGRPGADAKARGPADPLRRALIGRLRARGDAGRTAAGRHWRPRHFALSGGGDRGADGRHRGLLPAGDQGISGRRGLLQRRGRKPGRGAGPDGGLGVAGRLRVDRRRLDLGRGRGDHLGAARRPTTRS